MILLSRYIINASFLFAYIYPIITYFAEFINMQLCRNQSLIFSHASQKTINKTVNTQPTNKSKSNVDSLLFFKANHYCIRQFFHPIFNRCRIDYLITSMLNQIRRWIIMINRIVRKIGFPKRTPLRSFIRTIKGAIFIHAEKHK